MSWRDGVTIRATAVDGSVESIRFRHPMWQRLWPVLCVPVSVLFGAAASGVLLISPDRPNAVLGPMVMAMVGSTIGALSNRNRGVVLTPAALVVERLGGRRTIPWSEIEGFTIREILGSRQVVVHRVKGRRLTLAAPIGGFLGDRDFDRKYHTIGQWWLICR
jgi:hypothetical protein